MKLTIEMDTETDDKETVKAVLLAACSEKTELKADVIVNAKNHDGNDIYQIARRRIAESSTINNQKKPANQETETHDIPFDTAKRKRRGRPPKTAAKIAETETK